MTINGVNAAPGAETAGEDTARQHRVYVMATEKGRLERRLQKATGVARLKPTIKSE